MFDTYSYKDYTLKWCYLCERAVIVCPKCKNTSCNGGSCTHCSWEFDDFNKKKTHVQDYLIPSEKVVYERILHIKKHMMESLQRLEPEIDFLKMKKDGKFSAYGEKLFKRYFKKGSKK